MTETLLALALVTTSFAIALAALFAFSFFRSGQRHRLRALAASEKSEIVFLFENERLLDASTGARQVLSSAPRIGSDWAHLAGILQPRFPGLADRISDLAEMGEMSLVATDGTSRLDAEWHGGVARLSLVDVETGDQKVEIDRHSANAQHRELATLRAIAERIPYLTWCENTDGEITWANRAYLKLADTLNIETLAPPWPPARLFGRDAADTSRTGTRRLAIEIPGEDKRHWFDVQEIPHGDAFLMTAALADDVVHAERTLSEFIVTLTKTFADLPIGLAVFNRSRQLALFNPALTDLTLLPAGFLCAHPTLFAFLDQLREKRMMPEPKDYKSWRQQMADLEAKAVNGTYEETWSLPTGQTYRVTGRPHPDGAVAFLFEDISAEMSLTRRFRAELEMGQAALDSMTDAIAVFSPAGILSMSNAAYARLWESDPNTDLEDINVSDATLRWHQQCNPTPVWRNVREFVHMSGERAKWVTNVTRKDGRTLECRVVPMAQGATLISFHATGPVLDNRRETRSALTAAQA